MKKTLILIFLFLDILLLRGQDLNSIYAWEANNLDIQFLIKYSFIKNKIEKDTIFIDSTINHFEREEKIYKNYIISDNYIFDIKKLENKAILKKGKILKCNFIASNNSILFTNYNDILEYYRFDLQYDSLIKITNTDIFYNPRSPNNLLSLSYNHTSNKILLLKDSYKSVLGSFTIELEDTERGFGSFPMIWIDNNYFLTQTSNGKIVKVNLLGKKENIVNIKTNKKAAFKPILYKDCNNNFYYYIVFFKKHTFFSNYPYIEKNYLININNKTYTKTNSIGCNFTYSFRKNKLYIFKNNILVCHFKKYEKMIFNNNILAVTYTSKKKKKIYFHKISNSQTDILDISSKYFKLIEFL